MVHPPPPPTEAADSLHPKGKKRPLKERDDLNRNSSYYKIRLIVSDLRPLFIQVLGTLDFRNCKEAKEIQEQMKRLMELYKEIGAEAEHLEKRQNVVKNQPQNQAKAEKRQNVMKNQPQNQAEAYPTMTNQSSEKQQPQDRGAQGGTYIIGGSAFGWNFITFPGLRPAYCGVTKESFRNARANPRGQSQSQ